MARAQTSDDFSNRGLGWRPDMPDHRDLRFAAPLAATRALPAKFRIGKRWLPPIRDQWEVGSCTAFAGLGAFETIRRRQQRFKAFDPSELFTYYVTREMEFGPGAGMQDTGATIRGVIQAIARYGAAPEKLWPYGRGEHWDVAPPLAAYEAADDRQAIRYARVPQTSQQLAAAIATGFPVVIGFAVFESFMSRKTAETGEVPMPGRWDGVLGGHAVRLIGYDFTTNPRTFEFANSWSRGWGRLGYGRFPEAYLLNPDLADDYWIVTEAEA